MFSPQRRERILEILHERKQIVVRELAAELGVSEGTLRTDLRLLEEEGKLERTHGGAIPVSAPGYRQAEIAESPRSELNRAEKQAIGRAAAALVSKGQCVMLDASTTALELAKHLVDMDYLTVVTNGLNSAMLLNQNPRINVILIGGVLRPGSRSIEGLLGQGILEDIHADLFFTSSEGFTLETGMTDFSVYEAELKKRMAAGVSQVVALLDHTKLGRRSIAASIRPPGIHTLITDGRADPDYVRKLKRNGIRVMIAD
ncbi:MULTISPECIES: DeoR/GlpR family DNA-binding transcription regulator [Cohnella]|jgi:DeoR/GlpR family transcriptional regulator of sugar metabolism|uniref:DeoR/GlpR family DNA-binding transcription regulator n=1 Tax=Cohnella TaxID=329857 RepID=UPI0003747DB9|nr:MULTISPECIES: DeoR/GlpR family DNA-binding transcription regulator [Cohnella]REK65738.1 MAG: DeoR/GlpR transcriptional regulator [Cohnella sp.]